MKAAQIFKVVFILSIVLGCFSGCSDDDPEPGCFQEDNRSIVAVIKDATGTIRGPGNPFCSNTYVIEPDEKVESRPLGSFAACNLSNEFQVDGARVLFSGYVYESFETEDICADFFEITEIRLSTP
ncbi:MAG: hypothetical protein WBG90_09950 [Saonia sp.]